MNTIPVEQLSVMPLLLIFCALTALILLAVGIFTVVKVAKDDKRKTIVGGIVVGVIAAIGVSGVAWGVTAYTNNENDTKLQAAVTELKQNLNDEQIIELKEKGFLATGDDKTILFSDEGDGYNVTVYDSSDNAKSQVEETKKRNEQIAKNDY